MRIGERHTDQPIAVFSSPAHPSSGLYSQNLHRFPLHVQLGALLEQFYIEYQKYSEIALDFGFFRYVIGPENSRYFLNQSDSKPKPIPTWSLTVSRVLGVEGGFAPECNNVFLRRNTKNKVQATHLKWKVFKLLLHLSQMTDSQHCFVPKVHVKNLRTRVKANRC